MKGIRVKGPEDYVCPHHGPIPVEKVILHQRKNGYLHRRCKLCYDDLMRANRRKYNARHRHRDVYREQRRLARIELRREAIEHYGGVCACCAESQARFLTIDHVNNDGNVHREEMGGGGGNQIYLWLKKNGFPDGDRFRVLCYNCNLGRAFNGGICPHRGIKE